MHQDFDQLWRRLQRSAFRAKFRLNEKDARYLTTKGLPLILTHAQDFVEKRLADANPLKDGKQTPWHGHPVFVAQHATATCCRSCIEKWHQIPKGRALTAAEKAYIVKTIGYWLSRQSNQAAPQLP